MNLPDLAGLQTEDLWKLIYMAVKEIDRRRRRPLEIKLRLTGTARPTALHVANLRRQGATDQDLAALQLPDGDPAAARVIHVRGMHTRTPQPRLIHPWADTTAPEAG